MKNGSQGFTLLELMVSLSIVGILLAIATPSFREFMRNSRLTSVANDFLAAVQVARTEAIKRQQAVSICATADPTVANPTCALGDFESWIVFVDPNNDCERSGVGEDVLKADGPIGTGVTTVANGQCISFAPTGFPLLQPATGEVMATRILYCDDRGLASPPGTTLSAARGIFLTNTGRSRVSRSLDSGGLDEIDTWGLECP